MKKVIVTLVLIAMSFCFMSTLNGQALKPAKERAIEQTKIMGDELKLTAEQSANIYNINMYIDQKFDKLRDENYFNTAAMLKSVKQLDNEKNELLERVLTYRQYAMYLKNESKNSFVSGENKLSAKN